MLLMGVDVGTSSVKVSIIEINEKDRTLKQIIETSVPLKVIYDEFGRVEQDPSEYLKATFTAVKKALKLSRIRTENIMGIGVSAQCPTLVLLDHKGNPLCNAILYMDRRSEDVCQEVLKKFGSERLFKLTKNVADPYFAGYKLIWLARNMKSIYEKSSVILSAGQFLVYKLTGTKCIDRITACTFAPFYDWDKNSWSVDLLDEFGLSFKKLPYPIYPPYKIVGGLSSEVASKLKLRSGTPVAIGTCDAQAGALASGATSEGDSIMICGTTHLWEVIQSYPPKFAKHLLNAPYIFPNLYLSAAALLTTGAIIEWFTKKIILVKKYLPVQDVLKQLEEEARNVSPGSGGLIALPYFMGERSPIWDPYARGLILGLTLKHERAHIYRALLEGVAFALKSCKEIFDFMGLTPKEIIAINGAVKNKLWMEIISNTLGLPIKAPRIKLSSASGAALLAAYGLRIFKDPKDLKKYFSYEMLVEPNEKIMTSYEKIYSVFSQLYPILKDYMHKLSKMGYIC